MTDVIEIINMSVPDVIEIKEANEQGPSGPPGEGIPLGGDVGEILVKASSTDYDLDWQTLDGSVIGLGNCDNTSDVDKPISSATQTALDGKADLVDGLIPSSQLPATTYETESYTNLAAFPVEGSSNIFYVALDTSQVYLWNGTTYIAFTAGTTLGETSTTAYRGDRGAIAFNHSQIFGNPHLSNKNDVGLGNCDNTSDLNKPVSTATQNALNLKADLISPVFISPALGTPVSGIATNLTGTASGLTSGNVITNADLSGVIKSVGNVTSLTNQSGTGNIVVTDTMPILVTPILGNATCTTFNGITPTNNEASFSLKGGYNSEVTLTVDQDTLLSEKADLVDGKVPASQLSSVLINIEEYANLASFPSIGDIDTYYIALDTGLTYMWGSTMYVLVSTALALGETNTTAFRGDHGKIAYDFALEGHYAHPTGDGYLHVPATSTTNDGKVLTAGATAGSLSWETPTTGGSGDIATDSIWNANGDLVVGTGSNTAEPLSIGDGGHILMVADGEVKWEPRYSLLDIDYDSVTFDSDFNSFPEMDFGCGVLGGVGTLQEDYDALKIKVDYNTATISTLGWIYATKQDPIFGGTFRYDNGGAVGYVLRCTSPTGVGVWANPNTLGIAGGTTGNIQYNNAGALGGSANFVFDPIYSTIMLKGAFSDSGCAMGFIDDQNANVCIFGHIGRTAETFADDCIFGTTAAANSVHIATNGLNPRITITKEGHIGINNTTPSIYASLDVTGTDCIILPAGTDGQRPSSAEVGMLRYNTTGNYFEGYGTGWTSLAGGGGAFPVAVADGSYAAMTKTQTIVVTDGNCLWDLPVEYPFGTYRCAPIMGITYTHNVPDQAVTWNAPGVYLNQSTYPTVLSRFTVADGMGGGTYALDSSNNVVSYAYQNAHPTTSSIVAGTNFVGLWHSVDMQGESMDCAAVHHHLWVHDAPGAVNRSDDFVETCSYYYKQHFDTNAHCYGSVIEGFQYFDKIGSGEGIFGNGSRGGFGWHHVVQVKNAIKTYIPDYLFLNVQNSGAAGYEEWAGQSVLSASGRWNNLFSVWSQSLYTVPSGGCGIDLYNRVVWTDPLSPAIKLSTSSFIDFNGAIQGNNYIVGLTGGGIQVVTGGSSTFRFTTTETVSYKPIVLINNKSLMGVANGTAYDMIKVDTNNNVSIGPTTLNLGISPALASGHVLGLAVNAVDPNPIVIHAGGVDKRISTYSDGTRTFLILI